MQSTIVYIRSVELSLSLVPVTPKGFYMEIRSATREDSESIAELHRAETGRQPYTTGIFGQVANFPSAVAFDGSKMIAFALSQQFAPDILEITDLLVSRSHRNTGVGTAILAHLEKQAYGQYASLILCNSILYEAPGKRLASGFYERNGYFPAHETGNTTVFVKSIEKD